MISEHPSSPGTDGEHKLSGADLARVALQAARAAAKRPPQGNRKPKPRSRVRRDDSREPARLAAALTGLVSSHGWETPAAGGTVMDRWPQIAPELAETGNVLPVAFDAEDRVLTLRPANNAFGTHLRLFGQQLIERINTAMGDRVVHELRVLPPGHRPMPGAAAPQTQSRPQARADDTGPDMPRRTITRDQASDGYHKARAQLQGTAAQRPRSRDPHQELRERYFAGAYPRGPEVEVDPQTEAATERARRDAKVRRAAILRARKERTERDGVQAVRKLFGTTA